jgi:hypothetical protein
MFLPNQLSTRRMWALQTLIFVVFLASTPCFATEEAASAATTEPEGGGPTVDVYPSKASTAQGPIIGRMPVHLDVTLAAGYDDNTNPNGTTGSTGSAFTEASANLTYSFNGPRLQGSLAAGTSLNYYSDRVDNAYQPNGHVDLALGYAVSERLAFSNTASIRYQSEADLYLNTIASVRGGSFWYVQDSLSATYQWLPRLSSVTSYNFDAVRYDSPVAGVAQDHIDNGGSQAFRFLLLPGTTLTAEYRLNAISYQQTSDEALSQSILIGVEHVIGPRLRATLSGGLQIYSTRTEGMPWSDQFSPQFSSTLNYDLGAKTSLAWESSYSIEPSDVGGTSGRQTFRTGLRATYVFSQRISGSLSGYYRHEETDTLSTSLGRDDSVDVSVSLAYSITSIVSLTLNYEHTALESDFALGSYQRNRYSMGLTAHF